jgi:hypothetical protein
LGSESRNGVRLSVPKRNPLGRAEPRGGEGEAQARPRPQAEEAERSGHGDEVGGDDERALREDAVGVRESSARRRRRTRGLETTKESHE